MAKAELGPQIPFKDRMFSQGENVEQLKANLQTVVIYSGQARKIDELRQQGAELIKHPAGEQVFKKADGVLNGHFSDRFKEGIGPIILNGSEDAFKDNLQLIILLNDLACTRILEQEKSFKAIPRSKIIGVSGQSLGIVSAARYAGVIDEEILSLFGVWRHDAMRDAPGTLAGFTASDSDERIKRLKRNYGLETSIKTSSGFVVLGGEIQAVNEAIKEAESERLRAFPLETPGAFHTSLMKPSAKRFGEKISRIPIKDAEIDIFANTSGKPIRKSSDTKREFVDHMIHTVVWEESIDSMASRGAQQFVEIGSNGTLTGHIQRDIERKRPEEKGRVIKHVLRNRRMALIGAALIIPHATP